MLSIYPACFYEETNGQYSVIFPDLNHLATFGDTFEEAMNIAREKAEPGNAVLLSPACASWGMFKNYEERGRVFKEIVRSFKE